tara:strand:+ start:444 stop:596 length:153 start_codon:yes stop_codon:yes gene_type:complete
MIYLLPLIAAITPAPPAQAQAEPVRYILKKKKKTVICKKAPRFIRRRDPF